MAPSQRPEGDGDERERWKRIERAKTPEELSDALRRHESPASTARRSLKPALRGLFLLIVVLSVFGGFLRVVGSYGDVVSAPVGADTGRSAVSTPVDAELELPTVSAGSVGPVRAMPYPRAVGVVPAAGGDVVTVTPAVAGAVQPVWRPDGRALLVSVTTSFLELPVDSAGTPQWSLRRRLGNYRGASPVYAPDSRRIAYVAVLADVVVGDVRGTQPRLVTQLVNGLEPQELDWSSRDRLAVAAGGVIYVLTPRGRIVREVVAALPTAGLPAWSPDGRRIAYTQLNPAPGDGLMRVAVVEPGEGLRRAIESRRAGRRPRTRPGPRTAARSRTPASPAERGISTSTT